MEYILTGTEMSACDSRTSGVIGIPSLVLMERAALSVADGADTRLSENRVRRQTVLIAAGRGNNGADGLAAGRILLDRGYEVVFFRLSGAVSPDSSFAVQESILKQYGAAVLTFPEYLAQYCADSLDEADLKRQGFCPPDLIIDGLFGTGLSRELKGEAAEAVAFINACRSRYGSYVIGVDIPSGISSDDGQVMGCAVQCDETRTFAYYKRGHFMYPGASFAGKCRLAQIGITHRALDRAPGMFMMTGEHPSDLLPPRDPSGNKGTCGKILIVAGRKNMCGAALLAGKACLGAGAGMVKIFTHASNRVIIQEQFPEALLDTFQEEEPAQETERRLRSSLEWADICAAGPAMGTDEAASRILRTVLEYGPGTLKGLVLDADALRLISGDGSLRRLLAERDPAVPCILTPHMAEFAGLAGKSIRECRQDRADLVRQEADALSSVIACKDARTIVAFPMRGKPRQDALLYLNSSGNSGMATAGSGDVLTGMTAAYLAVFQSEDWSQRLTPSPSAPLPQAFAAAVSAVYLHGLAGDLARKRYGERGMKAGDLIESLRSPFFQ